MGAPVNLTAESFAPEVLQAEGPVVVDFWSATCPHCVRLAPEFDAAAAADEQGVKFAKVQLQQAPQVFAPHQVMGVPTMILFHGGQEVARHPGYLSAAQIARWLKEALHEHGG